MYSRDTKMAFLGSSADIMTVAFVVFLTQYKNF